MITSSYNCHEGIHITNDTNDHIRIQEIQIWSKETKRIQLVQQNEMNPRETSGAPAKLIHHKKAQTKYQMESGTTTRPCGPKRNHPSMLGDSTKALNQATTKHHMVQHEHQVLTQDIRIQTWLSQEFSK